MPNSPRFEVDNIWTRVNDSSKQVHGIINRLESTLVGGLGIWSVDDRVFSGLVPLILKLTNAVVLDLRRQPCEPKVIPTFVDRYYQKDAVAAAIRYQRGIIRIPTGGGKTNVAAGILGSLPCSWLYLVHKANLVESAAATFERLLHEKVGRIHGTANDPDHRIVCATFKSLASRPNLLPLIQAAEGIIVDEAHTLPALEPFSVVLNAVNAFYRIGLGATPLFREDRRDIHTIALLGPEIYAITPQELARNGFIVLPSVEWINCYQRAEAQTYPEAYNELIAFSKARNILLVNQLIAAPKPAIAFVKLLEHQDKVMELLKVYGAKFYTSVRGDTKLQDRNHIVERMKNGTLDIVVSSSVFNEGMDAPNLRTVIDATGQSSWIASIQEPGRGTRPSTGKDSFKMYDFNDVGNKWLEAHTAQRYAAYCAAGFAVPAPNKHAKKVLDTVSERSNMFEPELYREPPKGWDWRAIVGFGFVVCGLAVLEALLK